MVLLESDIDIEPEEHLEIDPQRPKSHHNAIKEVGDF
jgi:hypothetical protein